MSRSSRGPARPIRACTIDIALGIIASGQNIDIAAARERLLQAAARAGITEVEAARVLAAVYPDSGR